MQRALSYTLSPAPGIPLRFLLTAPWFALAAALLLLYFAEEALDSRWAGPTLALTHLLTLGFLSMAMAGSLLQLIPVVAGRAIAWPRAAAAVAWTGLCAGTLLLAAAFALPAEALFIPAALALAAGFAALTVSIVHALLQKAPDAALPMVAGMRFAVPGMLAAVVLGVSMAAYLGGGPALPLPLLADIHVAWGLLGWVAMLVVCVAFQVIPMFQATPPYPAALMRALPALLFLALLAWSAGTWLHSAAAVPAGWILAACVAAFCAVTLRLLARRKRREPDATGYYWTLSLCCLLACALLYPLPLAAGAKPLALGMLFIGGFAMGAVNGMLYKIVPFLLWYHLQLDPRGKKGEVPPLKAIVPGQAARRQFRCHALALALLLAALAWPAQLARPAALLLAASSLLLALDLSGAALRCRRIRRRFQPS